MKKYFLIVLTLFTFLTLISACTEDIVIPDPEDPHGPVDPIPPDSTGGEDPWDPIDPTDPTDPNNPTDPTDPTDPVDPIPVGNVPPSKVGNWFNGVFSFDEFWNYDGTYSGKISENARVFKFGPNGECEHYLTWLFRQTSYCKSETFAHYKGTVVFDEANSSFTFTPSSGTYRVFYNCASGSNINRPATAEDLANNTKTYYYHMEEVGGINYMVVKFSPTDTNGSYYKLVE